MADKEIRDIKIKTGVTKRYTKEFLYYIKEVQKEEERLQKFKSENKDAHDLRKQQEVITESSGMIGDTKSKLKESMVTLKKVMDDASSEVAESKECKDAQNILTEAQKVLDDNSQTQQQAAV